MLQATPDMGRTRWILILCAWTIVGLLFAVRRIVLVKVEGTHVNWVIESALELVWWYVWAAYTPLVIGLAKRFPLTGPRFVPHMAIHALPFDYRGSSVEAREKPLRGQPVATMTVPATTMATANPAPNSVVMYFAQPTGAVSGSNMP